ncbi:MAG: hypothetical protein ACOC0P_05630 [Planctomycetota bacterium]
MMMMKTTKKNALSYSGTIDASGGNHRFLTAFRDQGAASDADAADVRHARAPALRRPQAT